jgi:tRNA nucleotidyltransferase/poly(A) polymerase
MEILSKERIVEELNKILVTPRPSMGFRLLDETGLLDRILPQVSKLKGVETVEGKGHKENFSHTLEVLDNVAAAEIKAIADGTLKDFVNEDGVEAAAWSMAGMEAAEAAPEAEKQGGHCAIHYHRIRAYPNCV